MRARSNLAISDEGASTRAVPDLVTLHFHGVFDRGALAGEAFAGTLTYDQRRSPDEQHIGHCSFDQREQAMVALLACDETFHSTSATVFASIGDGRGNDHDILVFGGEGGNGCEFEMIFADPAIGKLAANAMPRAETLNAMGQRTLGVFHGDSASWGRIDFDCRH